MDCKVVITESAELDLENAALWYADISPDIARRWRQEMREHALSLRDNPLRCPVAHEESETAEGMVTVLAIRHSYRQRDRQ